MKKLSRKDFLKKTAIAGLAGTALLSGCKSEEEMKEQRKKKASGVSGKRYRWKMVTTWPPNFPILGVGCNLFAEWVEQMSGGRMKIRVYGGGELVPPLEAFDNVSSGTVELAHGCAYYWAGKSAAAQFFASVPFGMNAQQVNAWMYSGGGIELWRELYEKFNLVPYPAGNTGVQMGGWYNREINSIEDYKGLKMRMPGLGGKVLEKVGGTAVLSAGGEIYTNLERGVIDATEWIGPFHDYKMGFHKIAKYYYSPGWHECGTALELIVNKDKLASLPADLQAIIETAAARVNIWMLSEFEARNAEFLSKIETDSKVELRKFSPEILAQLRTYTNEIVSDLTASDPFAKKVYESYTAFRKNIIKWSEYTEQVYYNDIQS